MKIEDIRVGQMVELKLKNLNAFGGVLGSGVVKHILTDELVTVDFHNHGYLTGHVKFLKLVGG